MLQGSSVNVAGHFSDCCKAVQIVSGQLRVNITGQLSDWCRAAQ